MTITLPPEQMAWLEHVAAERGLPSAEAAVREIVSEAMSFGDADDDLDWAIPLIDEAREEVARGEVIPLEEFRAHLRQYVQKLRGA